MKVFNTNVLSILKTVVSFLLVSSFIILVLIYPAKAQNLPPGFSQVQVAGGITNPTTMAIAPDGRIFVAQQEGQLRVIENGTLLAQPFVSLTVNSSGERGLLGIAFDPQFATNNYIYLYYTLSSAANNRISRFTANGNVVVPGSEIPILDLDPLSSATNHNGGSMQFGPDGKLYVAIGENANSANSPNLDTYLGKILRINADGSVPAGNPFTSGSNQKLRVWSYGLRNPFTITFEPGTGRLFVNDVGEVSFEEINDATTGGHNFGWPGAEGNSSNPAYTNPVYYYGHGGGSSLGCAITGGTFFDPVASNYPATYIGKYFYIDYCGNWINMLTLSGSTGTSTNFGNNMAGAPVCIVTGPDGNLYFLSRDNSSLYKITYTGSTAPMISNQPQSQTVAQGNPVTFNVSVTGSAPLSYQWKKNTNDISGANSSSYIIAAVNSSDAGNYSVFVSNATGNVTSNDAVLTVTMPNQAPAATILTPVAGTTYAGGTTVNYSGSATDPESGILSANAFTWYVVFHHNSHVHPGPTAASAVTSGSFDIPNIGETSSNVFYRLYLVVTDPQGATDTTYTDILPRTSNITLNSSPPGFMITLDGQPFTTPYSFTGVEGILRSIDAPSPQTMNGTDYIFNNWSQGGSQTQSFATPVSDATYTANFTVLLPVELLSFTATARDNAKVYLEWVTVSEHNNKGFQVERSPDMGNNNYDWKKIGFINGNLNSTTTKQYSFNDEPLGGKRFIYRLKQIDLDENFKYSDSRHVVLKGLDYGLYPCYPNPVIDMANIQYSLPYDNFVDITLYDYTGKLVKKLLNENKEAGIYLLNFSTVNLPTGLYFYKMKAGNFSETKRFTIIR
ncbi:MAG: PQQ-dependent sugar dehydrogenase [Ferruginibacter sp.]